MVMITRRPLSAVALSVSVTMAAGLIWLVMVAVEEPTPAPAALDAGASIATVAAVVETEPVRSAGDAADDPAVFVHASDPRLSAVIGTDKKGALIVYGLDGNIRQELTIGRANNVDLRHGFIVDGAERTLVVTSDRSDDSLRPYLVDEAEGTLLEAHGEPIVSGVLAAYGLCLYQQPESGDSFAIVTSRDSGEVEQFWLVSGPEGIEAERVRELDVGSQSEGCVADDALGALYVAEERVGIWRYGADPEAGVSRVLVDGVKPRGNLVADVEGVTLALGEGDSGHLVVSSQGESSFAVYERGDENRFVGKFQVAPSETGIDGVTRTDGISVSVASLPPPFERGVLVVQDDVNEPLGSNQNFKLIRWADVVEAMGLDEVHTK